MGIEKKLVLILCPSPEDKGGVGNYYNVLKKYFSAKDLEIQFYFTGKRTDDPGFVSRIAYSVKDLLYLLVNLPRFDLVHLNPSLDIKSLIRDGVYHFIAKKIFRKKTIVFFRGWYLSLGKHISKKFSRIFKTFFNCDCIIVLADSFKRSLISWGYNPDIVKLETTAVDDSLLGDFSIEDRIARIDSLKEVKLLFLARIEKEKGILETIQALDHLAKDSLNICLVVAGSGSYMDEAQQFANKVTQKRVHFAGYVRGEEKKTIFLNSDIYVFPTYYPEGMPNSVLEAMATGLPVITRPVGALTDFFKNGEHGYMIESKSPADIAFSIKKIISDKKLWKFMARATHEYAIERFISSKVATRLEVIYRGVLKN